MPFDNDSFDIIIALHYFREFDTFKILNEIKKILTKKCYLIETTL